MKLKIYSNQSNQIIYNNTKSNNLKLSFQSEYVFKQNEFPNNDFTVFIPQTERFELVELSTPPKAYQLLKFNSSKDLNIFKKLKSYYSDRDIEIDYLAIVDPETFGDPLEQTENYIIIIAAYIENIRLIDNIEFKLERV